MTFKQFPKRKQRLTLIEQLIALSLIAAIAVAITFGYVAVHFILKFW